jgi:nitrate/nitrite transporter NarK
MRGVAGLNGWRWIFILEGILTVVVAVAAYFFIHNYPSTAKFLSEPERELIHARLKADNDAINDEPFTWGGALDALKDVKCWLYGLGFHTMSLPLYTLSLFLPTIIKDLGYTAAQAQLMTIPPYAIATVVTVLVAMASEKFKTRSWFIIGSSAWAIIGYIILLTAPSHKPGVSYVGTIFAAMGIYPAVATVLAWPANNVSGQTKRATANALQISVGNLGAVLGTQLYRPKTSPHFYLGHGFALGYLVANIVVVLTLRWVLDRENAQKREVLARNEHRPIHEEPYKGDHDVRWIFQT